MSVVKKTLCAIALSVTLSAPAQSAVIFSDNFDSYTLGTNATNFAGNWTVTNGSVDVIGNGFFNLYPGNGSYIDLDGSSNNAGDFSSKLLSLSGSYLFSFTLAGNARGGADDTVTVSFGNFTDVIVIPFSAPITTYSHLVNFAPGSLASVTFKNSGGDNVGAVLFDVAVTTVPEVETQALVLAGLGMLGLIVRRKKKA